MRKISPHDVLWDFEAQLEEQSDYYDSSWNKLKRGQQRKIATENFVLSVGVMFEGFINDLILAYANRDCSKVMDHLESSVKHSFANNSKAGRAFAKFGEFKRRKHLSKQELKEVLDPNGRNVSFPDYSAIETQARQWLVPLHCEAFVALSARDRAVVDATIAARNNMAHRSKSSLDKVNLAFEAGPLHDTGLRRVQNRIQRVGHYLKTMPNVNIEQTRADILAGLLGQAAERLVIEEE